MKKGEIVAINQGSEEFKGYFCPSATGSGPGVVVLQEWWGLVPHITDLCDRFGEAGFTALAPDLFSGHVASDPDEAGRLMMSLHISEVEQKLNRATDFLMAQSSTAPQDRVGVIGFCMGGQLALFAAGNNPSIRACVDFYGIHPNVRPVLRDLNGPVLGIFAEHDDSASPDAVAKLNEELTLLEKPHSFFTYPGTHHAFFNDTRPEVYNAEAASDAWAKVLAFFHDALG